MSEDREKAILGLRFKRFCEKPCFYYTLLSTIVLGLIYFGVSASSGTASMIDKANNQQPPLICGSDERTILSAQNQMIVEPPDLAVVNGDSLIACAPPRVMTQKVYGSIFGQGVQPRDEVIEYTVQSGDTVKSIADNYNISVNTILWANDLSSSSSIKVGQSLVILPVSGLIHIAKAGDTLSAIAKKYSANPDDIISSNKLASDTDIYVGDILVIPGGAMPKVLSPTQQTHLADNYFIYPVTGRITQTLHWYNGVDIGNQCGTSVFAAAAGTVLRATFDWKTGGGNYVTILHKNGVVTWYGHLESFSVQPGDMVDVGQKVGVMGGRPGMPGAGDSTGCHLHFTVIGATNPFGKLPLGTDLKFKN